MDHYDSSDDEGVDRAALLADPDAPASAAVIARALGGRSAGIILDDPYMQVSIGQLAAQQGSAVSHICCLHACSTASPTWGCANGMLQ